MEATLLPGHDPSIYRADPSPEVDAAWHRVSDLRPIAITKTDVLALGKDPKRAAKWPESFGFGQEAYIGRVDVFHQIHCLDALRREVHFDHYYGERFPGGYNTSDKLHKFHLSHCIHLLLQNLMCNANVDIHTTFWTDTLPAPQPDFNIFHKCRDFDTLLEWQAQNSVEKAEFYALRRPAEYGPAHRMSKEYKDIWHVDDDSGHPADEGEAA